MRALLAFLLVLAVSCGDPATGRALGPGAPATPTATPAASASPSPAPWPVCPPGPPGGIACVVPWWPIPAPPRATPAPSPHLDRTTLAQCRTDDLELGFLWWHGGHGALAPLVGIANRGSAPCAVGGQAMASLHDRDGSAISSTPNPETEKEANRRVVLSPSAAPLRPPLAEGQAMAIFVWRNWCRPAPDLVAIAVTLSPSEGAVRVPLEMERTGDGRRVTPACDDAAQPTIFWPAAVQLVPPPEPPRPALVALIEEGRDLAGSVRDGVRFVIALRNHGPTPVRLDPCPAYSQELFAPPAMRDVLVRRYLLDCAAVPEIAPGATARFGMVLELPPDLAPGSYALIWRLGEPSWSGDKAIVRIGP